MPPPPPQKSKTQAWVEICEAEDLMADALGIFLAAAATIGSTSTRRWRYSSRSSAPKTEAEFEEARLGTSWRVQEAEADRERRSARTKKIHTTLRPQSHVPGCACSARELI